MNASKARPVIILFLIAALAGAGYWYFYLRPVAIAPGTLTASGTVETTEISIASELPGKVQSVNVSEGDSVKTGDALFVLDNVLLKAQRDVAAAGLATAQSALAAAKTAVASAQVQYDIALSTSLAKDKATRTGDWHKTQPEEFSLPLWYYDRNEQIAGAQAEVDTALADLGKKQEVLANVQKNASSAEFIKLENELSIAQASYTVAYDLYNRVGDAKTLDTATRRQLFLLSRDKRLNDKGLDSKWNNLSSLDASLVDASNTLYDDAKASLKDAETAYYDAISTTGASDVLVARADVSIAQERYYTALDYRRVLETGQNSQAVSAAGTALDQVKASAAQAEAAVSQAQANVSLIDAQIAKTTITAPVDGVILTRVAEPGSVVNPGGVMLTLGRLDELTITVYVPEDRIGEVAIGQLANVKVDSFPGQTFSAVVTYIADQAEFTPRNVQTVEGRKNTVFAVKLKLDNTDGSLKPGMPADVVFGQK